MMDRTESAAESAIICAAPSGPLGARPAGCRQARFQALLAVLWAACTVALATATGCSLFQRPSSDSALAQSQPLRGSDSAEVFQRIREAKSQNAIVLQVAGDSSPIRVLPLPPDGQSVFVSDLLKQTGVQDKLGRIQATLYRATPEVPSGIKMDVRFAERSGTIRPETDYALQAGDRLRVTKDEQSVFSGMFDQFMPANGARAIRGY